MTNICLREDGEVIAVDCPQCGRTLSGDAVVCDSCRYLQDPDSLVLTEAELRRAKRQRIAVSFGALLVLLVLVFNFYIYPILRQIDAQRDFPSATELVMPSVMHIRAEDTAHGIHYGGTGFTIDNNGTIVTNFHVINRGTRIVAVDWRGREHVAEVIATDDFLDLAVIRISATTPMVELGKDVVLYTGQALAYIGDFGRGNKRVKLTKITVTSLVVGGRTLIALDGEAAQGNSGGPLFDMDGLVVGIITSTGGGATFAVPVSDLLLLLKLSGLVTIQEILWCSI